MPRIARGLSDGLIYHVINRGNGKQQVFHKDGDYRAFLNLMQEGEDGPSRAAKRSLSLFSG
jgi:putative transposase